MSDDYFLDLLNELEDDRKEFEKELEYKKEIPEDEPILDNEPEVVEEGSVSLAREDLKAYDESSPLDDLFEENLYDYEQKEEDPAFMEILKKPTQEEEEKNEEAFNEMLDALSYSPVDYRTTDILEGSLDFEGDEYRDIASHREMEAEVPKDISFDKLRKRKKPTHSTRKRNIPKVKIRKKRYIPPKDELLRYDAPYLSTYEGGYPTHTIPELLGDPDLGKFEDKKFGLNPRKTRTTREVWTPVFDRWDVLSREIGPDKILLDVILEGRDSLSFRGSKGEVNYKDLVESIYENKRMGNDLKKLFPRLRNERPHKIREAKVDQFDGDADMYCSLETKKEDVMKLVPSTSFSNRITDKLWIREVKYKNRSLVTSQDDRDYIMFLGMFRFAPVSILKNIHGKDMQVVQKELERLKDIGLVRDIAYPALGAIWVNTRLGQRFCESPLAPVGNNAPLPGGMGSALSASLVASFLWNNEANVLNLKDFPYHGRPAGNKFIRGEVLVSESILRSYMRKERKILLEKTNYMKAPYKGYYMEQMRQKKYRLYSDWQREGGLAPEFYMDNSFCWNIFPDNLSTKTFHAPDLVVRRERLNGEPQSIAVEVERKYAYADDYKQTFLAYKDDFINYNRIVWITNSPATAVRIRQGAKMADFKDYDILPFIDKKGAFKVDSVWFY